MSEQTRDYLLMCVRAKLRKDQRQLAKLRKEQPCRPGILEGVARRVEQGERALSEIKKNQKSS